MNLRMFNVFYNVLMLKKCNVIEVILKNMLLLIYIRNIFRNMGFKCV